MTDRELLEQAAKAAGYRIGKWSEAEQAFSLGDLIGDWWNPLTDDGDALRLAVKLRIEIGIYEFYASATDPWALPINEKADPDIGAATRRAVVKSAALRGQAWGGPSDSGKREPLTDKDGEVRVLTKADFDRMKPAVKRR